jgi:hypothetical protein
LPAADNPARTALTPPAPGATAATGRKPDRPGRVSPFPYRLPHNSQPPKRDCPGAVMLSDLIFSDLPPGPCLRTEG